MQPSYEIAAFRGGGMSVSFAQGNTSSSPLFPTGPEARPGNALTGPVTPGHRVQVIDKTQVDPRNLEAAQGMEAMFLDYMLKVMRESVPKQDMDLESPATGIYRGMQDSEYAQRAAHAGGIGLADQIVAYLESQRYTLARGQGVPAGAQTANAVHGPQGSPQGSNEAARVTGGTDEGRSIHK